MAGLKPMTSDSIDNLIEALHHLATLPPYVNAFEQNTNKVKI